MPASIGVNLRVTGNCRQGGRKYMEDFFSVAYQQTDDEKDLEYAFFGIFDGHGGAEAAAYAKEHLMETIIKHKNFWSDNDEDVLRAIKDGYIATHYAMWREQSKWPKTSSGLPSTAGTTASVAFIRRGKIYIGHVGDSGIILGYQEPGCSEWKAKPLTQDHKPENPQEMKRIEGCGGKVVSKSGVPRVVWNRPRIGHQGPVRRSTPIDEIPFLAVARSLGDLWSYNSQINQFIVSPDPDCSVFPIDANVHRCLIFGTDGLFNMLSPTMAVHIVQQAEKHNECAALSDCITKVWLNPSKLLVQRALERWMATKMRADNTSVVTLMLDPPGPPRAQVLKDRKKNLPESGLKIMTRYDECGPQQATTDTIVPQYVQTAPLPVVNPDMSSVHVSHEPLHLTKIDEGRNEYFKLYEESTEKCDKTSLNELSSNNSISSSDISSNYPLKERSEKPFTIKLRESTSFDPRGSLKEDIEKPLVEKENSVEKLDDNTIQINEISSSNIEESSLEEDKATVNCNEHESCPKGLISTKKYVDGEKKKVLKRKIEPDENTQRKSLRLTLNEIKKPAPCTLAEEKLKKLAEEAEKQKILKEQSEEKKQDKRQKITKEKSKSEKKLSSIAQKILKGKKINLKKKKLVKESLNKRKIKMASVLSKTAKSNKIMKQTIKKQVTEDIKKIKKVPTVTKKIAKKENAKKKIGRPSKSGPIAKLNKRVISGKLSAFKKQPLKNSIRVKDSNIRSKALKSVIENTNKKLSHKKLSDIKNINNSLKSSSKRQVLIENKGKKNIKGNSKESQSETLKKKGTRKSCSSILSIPRVVRGHNSSKETNAKENITPKDEKVSSNRKSAQKESVRKNTLRQRIQDKTKVIKKTVMRKS